MNVKPYSIILLCMANYECEVSYLLFLSWCLCSVVKLVAWCTAALIHNATFASLSYPYGALYHKHCTLVIDPVIKSQDNILRRALFYPASVSLIQMLWPDSKHGSDFTRLLLLSPLDILHLMKHIYINVHYIMYIYIYRGGSVINNSSLHRKCTNNT
jgi:hypothetical protein